MKWMRSHLSGRYPRGASYQEMFKHALRYVREREDPARRAERRQQRREKQQLQERLQLQGKRQLQEEQKRQKKQQLKPRKSARKPPKAARTRHIPVKEQDNVWVRDKGQCAYVGPGGRRCNATHNLQIDHYPVPYARGGPNTSSNLRLLCGKHNRFTAEKVYGRQHMAKYHRQE